MSGIQLRCKVFPGAFLLYFCKPRFSIDGSAEQIIRWGENTLPVPPGRHSLQVWFKYITGPTNVAQAVVDVPPEGLAMVYKTRWMIFLPGKLEPVAPTYGQGAAPGQYGQYGQPQGAPPQQQPYAPQQYAGQPAQPQPQPQPQAQPQPAQAPPAGWNPDPSGRHQHRWWDGSQWTSTVADNGVTTDDPL